MANVKIEIEERIKEFGKAFGNNLENKLKIKEEAMNKKIDELEANINITLHQRKSRKFKDLDCWPARNPSKIPKILRKSSKILG